MLFAAATVQIRWWVRWFFGELAQLARALAWHARGHRFESGILHRGRYMFREALVTTVMFLWALPLCAQSINPEFDLLLHGLLQRTVPEISAEQAYRQQADVVFLDARTHEEFEVSHLPQAVYVGYTDFDPARLETLDKEQVLVVYCSVGYRSERITQRLLQLGYMKVFNLYGGIFEWVNRGYPVVQQGKPTQLVHTFDKTWKPWLMRGTAVY